MQSFNIKNRVLLVDDDPIVLASVGLLLGERSDLSFQTASTLEEAQALIRRQQFEVAIVDYQLPGGTGASLTRELRSRQPQTKIIVFSGDESREALKHSWAAGADAFIEKGQSSGVLIEAIDSLCPAVNELVAEAAESYSKRIQDIGMVGCSKALAEVADKVVRYQTVSEPVLILGETGTGKELIANALHSGDKHNFFPINCAVFSDNESMLESELFGHKKGAFTGATQDKLGVFRAAQGGTVFLDELHCLSLNAQQKLLRTLQEYSVRPVGAEREIPVRFRLVASAKPEIQSLMEEGKFLPDLYERINVLRIEIPPLRERPEDVIALSVYFCQQISKQLGRQISITREAMLKLKDYSWPRNVRELENLIRRFSVDCDKGRIGAEDLKFSSTKKTTGSLRTELDHNMREKIIEAIRLSRSQREAARLLKIPESSLRRFLKRFGISVASQTDPREAEASENLPTMRRAARKMNSED